jgi:hypothetical protein
MHVGDAVGPNVSTPECRSQAVKVLKQRLLKRVLDSHNMDQCLIFCRCADLLYCKHALGRWMVHLG